MAALDANDWTVTISERWISDRKLYSRGTMALAGTDTYPTGGVPLPSAATLGFVRSLDVLMLTGHASATTSYLVIVDYANNKAQFYEEEAVAAGGPLLECDTAEVPGPRTFDFLAIGW